MLLILVTAVISLFTKRPQYILPFILGSHVLFMGLYRLCIGDWGDGLPLSFVISLLVGLGFYEIKIGRLAWINPIIAQKVFRVAKLIFSSALVASIIIDLSVASIALHKSSDYIRLVRGIQSQPISTDLVSYREMNKQSSFLQDVLLSSSSLYDLIISMRIKYALPKAEVFDHNSSPELFVDLPDQYHAMIVQAGSLDEARLKRVRVLEYLEASDKVAYSGAYISAARYVISFADF